MGRTIRIDIPGPSKTSVAPLQNGTANIPLVLNNGFTSIVFPNYQQQISFSSVNDLSGVVFTVTAKQMIGSTVETITGNVNGPNNETVTSPIPYHEILSIVPHTVCAGISVGTWGAQPNGSPRGDIIIRTQYVKFDNFAPIFQASMMVGSSLPDNNAAITNVQIYTALSDYVDKNSNNFLYKLFYETLNAPAYVDFTICQGCFGDVTLGEHFPENGTASVHVLQQLGAR